MFLKQAVERTRARFSRLYDTLEEEYWWTCDYFEDYGCSLGLKDVNKRSTIAALWVSAFIICVTLPVILYHRGFSEPSLFVGLAVEFGVVWILLYVLVFGAHFLWVLSFIVGRKVGGSDLFLNYIGERWGKRIDEITNKFVEEKMINFQKSEQCEECAIADNDGGSGDATDKMNNNNIEKSDETTPADKTDNEIKT